MISGKIVSAVSGREVLAEACHDVMSVIVMAAGPSSVGLIVQHAAHTRDLQTMMPSAPSWNLGLITGDCNDEAFKRRRGEFFGHVPPPPRPPHPLHPPDSPLLPPVHFGFFCKHERDDAGLEARSGGASKHELVKQAKSVNICLEAVGGDQLLAVPTQKSCGCAPRVSRRDSRGPGLFRARSRCACAAVPSCPLPGSATAATWRATRVEKVQRSGIRFRVRWAGKRGGQFQPRHQRDSALSCAHAKPREARMRQKHALRRQQ